MVLGAEGALQVFDVETIDRIGVHDAEEILERARRVEGRVEQDEMLKGARPTLALPLLGHSSKIVFTLGILAALPEQDRRSIGIIVLEEPRDRRVVEQLQDRLELES